MGNFWLKIKIWLKGIVIALVLVYVLVFVIKNSGQVEFWWWYNHQDKYSMLLLIAISFFAGVISTVLVRTTMRTIRQVRELRGRSRTQRMEQDLAEMKEKAARLQTKPQAASPPASSANPLDSTENL